MFQQQSTVFIRLLADPSRDPNLVTRNTDPMLTKKIQETLDYKPRPKSFLGNLQIQVQVNDKHDRSANLLGNLSKATV